MNLKYLKHIDGLRAIAVLLVLFNHLSYSFFTGGYIGVDVFFVISGFLITRIILNEYNSTSSFSYLNFYFRRAKRILPALFVVLGITLIAAFFLFSPNHFQSTGGASFAAALSLSNIYFWKSSGYFDLTSSVKPLLHTWSLGVEEQFYLIWPAILIFSLKRKISIPILVAVLFISSLSANILLQKNHLTALFYGMPFRIFEFSLGAILCCIPQYKSKYAYSLEMLSTIGFALILIPAFYYTKNTLFPSYNAVFPAVGASFLIYAGYCRYMGFLLTNPLSRGIGLISYSLYLIHWPLIVFTQYINDGELLSYQKTFLLVISIMLATLMYFYIEQPFRKIKFSEKKRKVSYIPVILQNDCIV